MTEPVEFRNSVGKSRWQPQLKNGERLYGYGDWCTPREARDRWFRLDPFLTSRRHAIRLALRKQKCRDREEALEFWEVR